MFLSFKGHPLNGNEFSILGKCQLKDGLYYVVELPDKSTGYLPAKWFVTGMERDLPQDYDTSLIASVESIRRILLLVSHLETKTPPNVE